MKKKSLRSLALNKKTISAVKISSSIGGDNFSTYRECRRTCIFSVQGDETCVTC